MPMNSCKRDSWRSFWKASANHPPSPAHQGAMRPACRARLGRAFASFPTTLIFRSGTILVRCGSQFPPLLKISVVNSLGKRAHFACGTHLHALLRKRCRSNTWSHRCARRSSALRRSTGFVFPAIPPPVVESRDA